MRVGGLIAGMLLLALLATPARAQDPPSAPVYTQSVTEELRIPTEYGSIYGWVRRPVVPPGARVPIILTYSPYQPIESPQPGMDDGTGDYYVPRLRTGVVPRRRDGTVRRLPRLRRHPRAAH